MSIEIQEQVQRTLRQEVKNTENLMRNSPFLQEIVNCAIFHNVRSVDMGSFKEADGYYWTNPFVIFSDSSCSEFDLSIMYFIEEMAFPHDLVSENLTKSLENLSTFVRYVKAINKNSTILINENGVVASLGFTEVELDTIEDTKEIIEQLHKINDGLNFIHKLN